MLEAIVTLLSVKKAEDLFDALAAAWPDAHCELAHHSPFQLLVAVVLSAQTTDKAVNKALAPLLLRKPHFGPEDLVAMGVEGFLEVIKSIGLAPTKARNCVALSSHLLERHGGRVPAAREELEALPGVGRKTANVVLNVVHGLPTMAVDTHVARLAVRMGLCAPTSDRLAIEQALVRKVPERHAKSAHHHLIFHGRYHCIARAPRCETCAVARLCPRVGVPSPSAPSAKRKRRDDASVENPS
jgi:endonuclease-3